jgi:SAM-dependent methyltransferase
LHSAIYSQPERYERGSPGLAGDVDHYRRLAMDCAGPVLELGCGTGRIARAIAGTGIDVVGIDREAAMLKVAKERTAVAARVDWIQGDMRGFALGRRFRLVVAAYRTLQHLLREEEIVACLCGVYHHLEPGGLFAFDISNPDALRLRAVSCAPLLTHPYRGLTLRQFFTGEMAVLLTTACFTIEALQGGFDQEPVSEDSTETVWLASRPTDG